MEELQPEEKPLWPGLPPDTERCLGTFPGLSVPRYAMFGHADSVSPVQDDGQIAVS